MYNRIPIPIWRKLLMQVVSWARSLAPLKAGSSMLANIPMIAITTSNSIRVNPP